MKCVHEGAEFKSTFSVKGVGGGGAPLTEKKSAK